MFKLSQISSFKLNALAIIAEFGWVNCSRPFDVLQRPMFLLDDYTVLVEKLTGSIWVDTTKWFPIGGHCNISLISH